MKFPKKLRHRGRVLATIYGKNASGYYRLYWRVRADGKPRSRMRDFPSYSEAKREGDRLVADLAKGSKVTFLTPGQAADALAALETLQSFYQSSGKRFSLNGAAVQFTEAASKLGAHSLTEAVDGFLDSVVTVKRISVHEGVEQFIAFRKGKTVAAEGRRPQLSGEHWRNTGYWLREFAETFPGHNLSDLTKQHIDAYITKFAKAAPKTRNERRAVVRMFLAWAVEQDFLAPTHRLAEASQLKHESGDAGEIECYTAPELRAMLEAAPADLQPVLALAGLAGLREKEILRLTWRDIFRVPGHIEVSALNAKTRSRRLVEVCASLAQWLEPYRGRTGTIWPKGYQQFHAEFAALRADLRIQHRRNGLRHAFVSAHYALGGDEGRTAQQAGNSPAMVHHNYKKLMAKPEAEAWFAVSPQQLGNVVQLGKTG